MVVTSASSPAIAGIVLAGGLARRLGGDKALRLLGGKPLLTRAIDRAQPQVDALAVSANGDLAPFLRFGLPILTDTVPGFVGPLAGILAGMDWAAAAGHDFVASFACDTPFFPRDLVTRLATKRDAERADIACAASEGRVHPVFALWPVRVRDELRHSLTEQGARKVEAWAAHYRVATVPFPALPVDPFFNVNTPDDLARAETLLAKPTSADNGGPGHTGKL